MPPPIVGTTVVVKFGVGENSEWREGECACEQVTCRASWVVCSSI